MLPPIAEGSQTKQEPDGTVYQGPGASVLTWDGQNSLAAATGVTAKGGNLAVVGTVQVGQGVNIPCSTATEGTERYNATANVMEFCNGTGWTAIGGGASWVDVALTDKTEFNVNCQYRVFFVDTYWTRVLGGAPAPLVAQNLGVTAVAACMVNDSPAGDVCLKAADKGHFVRIGPPPSTWILSGAQIDGGLNVQDVQKSCPAGVN